MTNTSHGTNKFAEEFDQALQQNAATGPGANIVPPANEPRTGGVAELPGGGGNAQTATAAASTDKTSPMAPGVASDAPGQQALSSQAEGKLAVGEELRDREFEVPEQDTHVEQQILRVDQETMNDSGPRQGGAIGTVPGDRPKIGELGSIEDQVSKTPDLQQSKG